MPLLERLFDYVSPTVLISSCVLGYIMLYLFSIYFTKSKRAMKSPFIRPSSLKGNVHGKPQLVTNQRDRDIVLKQAFNEKRIPDGLDVIVIGSGIGSLSTAAFLARSGKRVLVLEQHDQAGGCCHTYIEKGYEFDVGIHYIGNMHPGSFSRNLVDEITDANLDWVEIDDEFDTVHMGPSDNGKRFQYIKSREETVQRLLKMFPDEEQAIQKFFDILRKIRKSTIHMVYLKVFPLWLVKLVVATGILPKISDYFYYNGQTLQCVLNKLTANEELKCVLSYCFGDYGSLPADTPITMQSALINHFINGAFYPKGGASEIAFHIIPVIEASGGRVLVKANVAQVLANTKGRVVGVQVKKSSGDTVNIFAPTVISGAGIPRTAQLLPGSVLARSNIPKILSKCNPGVGCFSLFVGLKISQSDLAKLGFKAQNMWAFTSPEVDRVTREFLSLSADDAARSTIPLLFVSMPSTKDPTWESRYPGKSTVAVITLARWDWFSEWENNRIKHRGDDYDNLKAAFQRNMWEQTQELFPHLRDIDVEYMEMGTPVTNSHYIHSTRGEIYGLDHDMMRLSEEMTALLRPDVGVPGLLITGQDVLSCGFMGALYGGVLCASHYLKRNLLTDLHRVSAPLSVVTNKSKKFGNLFNKK